MHLILVGRESARPDSQVKLKYFTSTFLYLFYNEKVMIPTAYKVATDEDHPQPRAGALGEIEEVKKEPRNTQDKLLDLLMSHGKRMERIEASQEEKERYKGHEASLFGSVLGQGKPMSSEALDLTLPRRVSPGVLPSTYCNVLQRGYAETAANVEMTQAPQPALPQHFCFYRLINQPRRNSL